MKEVPLLTHLFLPFFCFAAISPWCACLFWPIAWKPSPTLKSVVDDKCWSDLLPRSLSNSCRKCKSTVRFHALLSSGDADWIASARVVWLCCLSRTRSRRRRMPLGVFRLSLPIRRASFRPRNLYTHKEMHILTHCFLCHVLLDIVFAIINFRIHWRIRNHWWSQVQQDCHWFDGSIE